MLQIGFYTQVLERSIVDHWMTPTEEAAHLEEALAITKEDRALVELERSATEEAR